MKFDIMTLFPDMVDTVLSESIIGRARKSGALEINVHNIRDYSEDKHRRVDDTPCGGGRGMLMAAPPIYNCWKSITGEKKDSRTRVVYMSPRGRVLDEALAKELSEYDRVIVLCGHYEGVDQRVIDEIVDDEVSIGDFVLTGGEVPACILCDAVGRLCEGVLPEAECHEKESFEGDLLEYPQYTRPVSFMGREVPEVLLSGHHKNIEAWRLAESEKITEERRPDLFRKYSKRLRDAEEEKKREKALRRKLRREAMQESYEVCDENKH